jgi:hypothetical protein
MYTYMYIDYMHYVVVLGCIWCTYIVVSGAASSGCGCGGGVVLGEEQVERGVTHTDLTQVLLNSHRTERREGQKGGQALIG